MGTYRSHRTLQDPNLYPFVLAQIFAVFFTIAKNSANTLRKYFRKYSAKICATLIYPKSFSQFPFEINVVQKNHKYL